MTDDSHWRTPTQEYNPYATQAPGPYGWGPPYAAPARSPWLVPLLVLGGVVLLATIAVAAVYAGGTIHRTTLRGTTIQVPAQVFPGEVTVHGRVVDGSGLPVAGASVVLSPDAAGDIVLDQAVTDADGEYYVTVREGAHYVVVTEGSNTTSMPLVVSNSEIAEISVPS